MKKIDLHIHTKASPISDSAFDFSLSKLKEYVESLSIDCIAITNHNLFDLEQFREIDKELSISVLPGIEINFENGHLLLISDNKELEDFESKCSQVERLIQDANEFLTIDQFRSIYPNLEKYLLIPHYDKKPYVNKDAIKALIKHISAGEVGSHKKFIYCIKDNSSLVPVLFSDLRFKNDMTEFSPRQTFIDIDDTSFKAINTSLLDKSKVFLYPNEGHKFFQVFENGQKLSTGLNVILGKRSSGKTFTLKRIEKLYDNVKHIKQFELLETDEEKDKKKFNELLTSKQSTVSEQYLKEFKFVVDDVLKIDNLKNEAKIDEYYKSLIKVAIDEEKKDVYSKCVVYHESKFLKTENDTLKQLISSTKVLIENNEYKDIIEKHINSRILLRLIIELMEKYISLNEVNLKKMWVNSLVNDIQSELRSFTSSSHIEDIDLYGYMLEKEKLRKFEKVVCLLKSEKIIKQTNTRRFKIIASVKKYQGAQALKNKSKLVAVFSKAFDQYELPVKYLDELKKIPQLPEIDYYKYFVYIDYQILNEHNAEVSGGERSEYNLLDKIQNAHHYDLLLIDEPESSFDNLFLKNDVNEQIKQISKNVPVILVTHNNTVGASINPDFILYTKREIIDSKAVYKVFSGHPSSPKLKTVDGEEIDNYDIMLNCLEAGEKAYSERGRSYEVLKN